MFYTAVFALICALLVCAEGLKNSKAIPEPLAAGPL